jgi:TolB-like protein
MKTIRTPKKREAFIDALREGISIAGACRIAGMGRNAAYVWRNDDEAFAGEWDDALEEGTDILEGSIQASSDRVRITAKLIEAATGRHVSSNRYDRPLEDIFAIQDEVTEKVAGTLTGWEGAIAEAERAVARRKPPANLQAYDYYLLGIEAKHKETKEDNIRAQELA